MAIDVAGDLAASMFARRGVGCIWQETHVLALRGGQWALLGGGGGTSDADLLADRPAVLPDYLTLGHDAVTDADLPAIVVNGIGGVLDHGGVVDHGGEPGWLP